MFTFLGILLLLVAIANYVLDAQNEKIRKHNASVDEILAKQDPDEAWRNRNALKRQKELFDIPGKWYYYLPLALLTLFLNGVFFYADAGTAYAVQYITGGDKMIKTQGLKAKWWGRTIPVSYEMSIKDVIPVVDRATGEITTELTENKPGIYNRWAKKWEFADAIKADIAVAVIAAIEIDDEEVFLDMADKNRSEAKLIYGRILPNIEAALKNTCKLMDAQDYIAGEAADFDRYFRDQLENGTYRIEEYYDEEEELPEVIGDTSAIRTLELNKNSTKRKKYRIMRRNGDPVRDNNSNSLRQYGISIKQANVTGIDWEPSFDKRLDEQKTVVAQTQYEKQEAEKELYRAKKEIAKGESEKAAERARLEKEQIKLTIAAETEAKVAEQNLIAEKKKYEVAQFAAKSKKVAADALAYENRQLVNAGLTPQERMEMDIRKNKDKWSAISTMKFDGVYMTGGAKGNDGILSQLLGAEVAKGMKNK